MNTSPAQTHPPARVGRIGRGSYHPFAADMRHVFLTGDLKGPSPHPYFQDGRVEFIYCEYQPGDDGAFHWHRDITEYQIVISGRFGFREASDGCTTWFEPGDVSMTPPGVCVERRIEEPTVTIALKVPSLPGDKVYCVNCARACEFRQNEFEG
jgi:hypothetical protein